MRAEMAITPDPVTLPPHALRDGRYSFGIERSSRLAMGADVPFAALAHERSDALRLHRVRRYHDLVEIDAGVLADKCLARPATQTDFAPVARDRRASHGSDDA
jgi:hypothetical protein